MQFFTMFCTMNLLMISIVLSCNSTAADDLYPKPERRLDDSGPIRITGVFITPDVQNHRAEIVVKVENKTSRDSNLRISSHLFACNTKVSDHETALTVGRQSKAETKLIINIDNPHLWSPENPFLYSLSVDILDASGKSIDSCTERFGMRNFKIGDDRRLYLNGRPIYLRGNAWVPEWYAPIPFEPSFCRKLLSEQKRQGFNYIRHHSTVPPYKWYYDLCDELGLMISVEMGFDPARSTEIVSRYYNHPSIIFWAGINEMVKPGSDPQVQSWYKLVKGLDSSRYIYDCAGYGEYDRDTTDVFNWHFGYNFPYLMHENLYSKYDSYAWPGSAKGAPSSEIIDAIRSGTFVPAKPQMIHELQGNAQVYSDKTLILDNRMRKIWEKCGYDYADWLKYVQVCQKFVNANYKVDIEAARRVDDMIGFDFLTVADSDPELIQRNRWPRYGDKDITGTCDRLGNSKPLLVEDLHVLNGAHVVLIDTHCQPRTLRTDESIKAAVMASCFDYAPPAKVNLAWKLINGKEIVAKGNMSDIKLKYPGVGKITDLDIRMPSITEPAMLRLEIKLTGDKKYSVSNNWKFWVFPPVEMKKQIAEKRIFTNIRWLIDSGFANSYTETVPESGYCDLYISDKLGNAELDYLNQGGRLLLLQNHREEGFSCISVAYRHRMYHHLVGGNSMGIVVYDHPALGSFPHEDYNDLQFYQVMQDADLLMLDDLPVRARPILESVPALEQNQPVNSGHLFEIGVGRGRLLTTGLKLDIAAKGEITSSWLLREFITYCLGDQFTPKYQCTRTEMEESLRKSDDRVWLTSPPFYLYPDGSFANNTPAGGAATAWINPQNEAAWGNDEWGLHCEGKAIDGYRSSYWEPKDMPADLGVVWPQPVTISDLNIEFLDNFSIPADDGWEFQIDDNGTWKKLEVKCEKLSDRKWNLYLGKFTATRFRLYFTKMNAASLDAVACGEYPGGPRAGHPFRITRVKERAVPRIREMKPVLIGN
ncbi:MAG: glycoside hydrolase family 2 TIM barrel-domain containing protein [Armatimonadota bacterium]